MINIAKLILPSKRISYANLKAEQKICIEFANDLRLLTLGGSLPYVWFHIANEFLPSQRVNFSFELKLKHMGKIAGVPDYCFIGANDSFFIEFKREGGKQTDNQKLFHEWCSMNSIDYFLCHSSKDGINIVKNRIENNSSKD